ncbi:MAG: CDP-glucose 4,6-dehydratase [Alphaproteobacteria bacterium]|nr:CDP-glucose 4,6-dehydratase [Alphaproteobacteria bacterium]MBU0796429.1 CDP-glucose 4,6-dehydratase [Alphaproteobacteria bacterium]MBU0886780.1 CDP-glucose 4,6-dehydratase [Alphaproteobacteria bacterium]MBU1812607.1 CDP-glucose 4,6-dehydratase [Alphaproteobacteria bacterium]
MEPALDFWRGKRVLITGHTGFKGGWLALWLTRLGARVTGIALPPNTSPNLFDLARIADGVDSHFCDIRDADALSRLVRSARPDIVFHLAAQPLVRASYDLPLETFSSNVMGTAHLLEALRGLETVRVAVMVTTDKVYRNHERPQPYREDDPLGGHDPYSASKAASEMVIASYRDAFLAEQGVAVSSARAGNVIGGGDWSADRLIPDAVRAWQAGAVLDIRRPHAVRPWQHVLEPLAGYIALARQSWDRPDLADAYNFGPDSAGVASVRDVVEMARGAYGAGAVRYGNGQDGPHEAGLLALDAGRARSILSIAPKWPLAQAVDRALAWYSAQQKGSDARALCEAEFAAYETTR